MIIKQVTLTTRCSQKMKEESEKAARAMEMNISEYFRYAVAEMNKKVLEKEEEEKEDV